MEVTIESVKAAIEGQNVAFAQFREANDQRIKQIEEKGVADPLLDEKLAKINADLDAHTKITDKFAELEAKFNRMQLSTPANAHNGDSPEAQLRIFNRELKSTAQSEGKTTPPVLSMDQFEEYRKYQEVYLRRGPQALLDGAKAMSVGGDPDGGYTVTPDISGRIATRVYETSAVRQVASVQVISTDRLEGLNDIDADSALTGGWVGETAARAETGTPTFGKWSIPVHEQYENPAVTQKLLDDSSINIEQWLARKVADKMARRQNTAFVTGNGVDKPRGFTTYTTAATADSARAWGTMEHVASGTPGVLTDPDVLISLVHKLKSIYRSNARWAMNRSSVGTIRQLKANAEYIWLPSMSAGQPSTLLGYPVSEFEDMPDIASSALAVAFGDFREGYQIVDRIGIRTLRDPFTNKPYVHFYTTSQAGGDVTNYEAIKFVEVTPV